MSSRLEKLPRRECRRGLAAEGNNQVAGLDLLEGLVRGDDADRPAEDERVGEVAFIEDDRPVDGGDAHAVAVVADARDDAVHHPARMRKTLRQLVRREVRGAKQKTSVLHTGLAARPVPRRSRMTPPRPVGAAIGLDRRG